MKSTGKVPKATQEDIKEEGEDEKNMHITAADYITGNIIFLLIFLTCEMPFYSLNGKVLFPRTPYIHLAICFYIATMSSLHIWHDFMHNIGCSTF